MALQEQNISFKFAGGVETKMDSKAVPTVRLLGLENGVFTKAISIKKRNGYTVRSRAIDGSASLVSGVKRLGQRGSELLQFTGNRCYSMQTGTDQWSDAGAVICAVGDDREVVNTSSQQTSPDHATSGGVTVYAWEDSRGGVWWTVEDTTGRVYRAPAQADASGERPRCVAVGNVLHVYYAVPSLQRINVLVINPSSPSAAVTPQLLIEDLDVSNPNYDAVPTSRAGNPALIVWHEHATTNIRIGYVTEGGILGSPASGHPSVYRLVATADVLTPVGVAYRYVDGANGDYLALAYHTTVGAVTVLNGGTTTTGIGSTTLTTTTTYAAPNNLSRVTIEQDNGTAYVVWEETAGFPSERYCVVNSIGMPGAAGTERTIRSIGLASRAFHAGVSGDIFAVFVHDTTYFNTYVTLRLSDFVHAGRHMPAEAYGQPVRTHLPSVHVTSDVARVVLPYKTRLTSTNNDKFGAAALRMVELDFDSVSSHQIAPFGAGAYMAGACPMHYDGRAWTEQGFDFGPERIDTVSDGAAGSMTPGGTYEYVVWYEWTDNQGEIHRGPTSVNTTITLGGGDTEVVLTVPMLRVTQKTNVRVCVARSINGDASRLWRVSSLDPTTSGAAANGYIANDTTTDRITFKDRLSDTDLQKQEELYTTGGILSNDPSALGSHVAAGKNRLFFTDAQEGNVVRFSQRRAAGFGLEIAPELKHEVDPVGGDITAIAVMEDIVFVFKRDRIFAFNGDGPYENGSTTNGGPAVVGFSASQIITSDVGCINPASIALTPDGLMFQSAKGIYLLSPSRDVTYIGSPVELYNSQDVRRASVLPDRNAVLFLTSSGKSLYFDFLFKQWSTFTNHEGYDAAVVDGTFYYLRTNDVVFQETPGSYSDNGTRITLRLETAWLHLSDHLQGFQRFWKALLLGAWSSAHQLGISIRTSYQGSDTGGSWSEPYWLDATGETSSAGWLTGDNCDPIGEDPITGTAYGDGVYGDGPYGGTDQDVYQWRYGIHEDGQAIQFRFEDFEKVGLAGASFELIELAIIGGVKKVDYRPFSGARST